MYQNYKNFETFAVHVCWSSDADHSRRWHRAANESWLAYEQAETSSDMRSFSARRDLAEAMRAVVNAEDPLDGRNDVYSTLLDSAIENVNWDEVADLFLHGCPGYERLPDSAKQAS